MVKIEKKIKMLRYFAESVSLNFEKKRLGPIIA
jgi:hypothetical protein